MKNIKLLTLLILTTLLSLTGCSKDNDGQENSSDYFMSYEINNERVIYKDLIQANHNYNASLDIYGISLLGGEPNSLLTILLYDTEPIHTSTYTESMIPDKYLTNAMITHSNNTNGFTSASPVISTVANANVTITEINDTYIAGIFDGVLVANSDYNMVTHTIKNGKFKIKFFIQ